MVFEGGMFEGAEPGALGDVTVPLPADISADLRGEVATRLSRAGKGSAALDVLECGSDWLVLACSRCGKPDPLPRRQLCGRHTVCPNCAHRRSQEVEARLHAAAEHQPPTPRGHRWAFLTFTLPPSVSGADTSTRLSPCYTAVAKGWREVWRDGARPGAPSLGYRAAPRKRKSGYKYTSNKACAAFWSIEVAGRPGKEHVHLHVLYRGPWVTSSHLRDSSPHIAHTWARGIGADGCRSEGCARYSEGGVLDPDVRLVRPRAKAHREPDPVALGGMAAGPRPSTSLALGAAIAEVGKYSCKSITREHVEEYGVGVSADVAVRAYLARAGRNCQKWAGWLHGFHPSPPWRWECQQETCNGDAPAQIVTAMKIERGQVQLHLPRWLRADSLRRAAGGDVWGRQVLGLVADRDPDALKIGDPMRRLIAAARRTKRTTAPAY